MFTSAGKSNKIIQFDDSSQSDEQWKQKNLIMTKDQTKAANPQKKKSIIDLNQTMGFRGSKLQNPRDNESSRCYSLRRNKSFKVKKQGQPSNRIKRVYNKSVSKFKNIFEQAQQMDLKSQSKFAVHQSGKEPQNENSQSVVKFIQFKSNQSNKAKNVQFSSVLKLSNHSQVQIKREGYSKVKIKTQDLNSQNKMHFRKTQYSEKPMSQLLERKLSACVQYRTEQKKLSKKQVKVTFKVKQVQNMTDSIHKKIASSQILIAKIKKDTSGFNSLWPQFHMYDLKTNIHILSAKKKAANTTSNYYISRNQKQIAVQNADYMGKVRSNFLGSCFNIFSQGANPQDTNKESPNIRKLLATVIYQSQIANANPKTMRIYMMKTSYSYYQLQGTNMKQQQTSLQDLYEIGQNKRKIYLFRNKKPIYNKKENKFVLNFDGRIKRPSTKNFILEDTQTKKQVLMFGKTQDQQYSLYVSNPLTPHIGLGIALAQLDNKIVCD